MAGLSGLLSDCHSSVFVLVAREVSPRPQENRVGSCGSSVWFTFPRWPAPNRFSNRTRQSAVFHCASQGRASSACQKHSSPLCCGSRRVLSCLSSITAISGIYARERRLPAAVVTGVEGISLVYLDILGCAALFRRFEN